MLNSKDNFITRGVWTLIEANTGIICACLPMLKRPLTFLLPCVPSPAKASTHSRPSRGSVFRKSDQNLVDSPVSSDSIASEGTGSGGQHQTLHEDKVAHDQEIVRMGQLPMSDYDGRCNGNWTMPWKSGLESATHDHDDTAPTQGHVLIIK